jgi:hypothetical protein
MVTALALGAGSNRRGTRPPPAGYPAPGRQSRSAALSMTADQAPLEMISARPGSGTDAVIFTDDERAMGDDGRCAPH